MSDLIVLENVNAVEVFNGTGLDPLLEQITKEAKSVVPDVKTAKGRKTIASMAAKVAKSKTYLDGAGKDLVSDWKTKAKAVDSERKKMRDYLDNLKAEVRQPLTEWEYAEETRISNHQLAIQELIDLGEGAKSHWDIQSVEATITILARVKETKIDDSWDEFVSEAAIAKEEAVTLIEAAIEKREKYNAEQVELNKLRIEAEQREKKDREEQLRKEGEERAKLKAEAKAQAESVRVEAERKEETERVENERFKAEQEQGREKQARLEAELRATQAEERAAREIEEAAQKERDRIEAERVAEELAAKKREADKKHKAKINNAAAKAMKDSLMAYDSGEQTITLGQAKLIVTAIAQGKVPYTKISY